MLWYVLYKSSIDIEPVSLTLHGLNACFIHHPSNAKNYSIGCKSETVHQKKKVGRENKFFQLYTGFGVKIQNTHHYRNWATFWHLTNWRLMAHQMA